MGVYGYCVGPAGHAVDSALRGLGGAAVRAHEVDSLVVVVSDTARPEPTADHVQQHNAVVEAIVTDTVTPVPLRFGQWSDDIGVFEGVIREKAAWYAERLAAFAGALEFGLRVIRPDKTPQAQDVRDFAPATGLEYMKALQQRLSTQQGDRAEGERVRSGIMEVLGAYVREERVDETRTPHGVVTVSHLVSRSNFDAYRDSAQALRGRFPEMRFLVSGPWVPYSFAT